MARSGAELVTDEFIVIYFWPRSVVHVDHGVWYRWFMIWFTKRATRVSRSRSWRSC